MKFILNGNGTGYHQIKSDSGVLYDLIRYDGGATVIVDSYSDMWNEEMLGFTTFEPPKPICVFYNEDFIENMQFENDDFKFACEYIDFYEKHTRTIKVLFQGKHFDVKLYTEDYQEWFFREETPIKVSFNQFKQILNNNI